MPLAEDPCQHARMTRACHAECQRRDFCPIEDEAPDLPLDYDLDEEPDWRGE